MGTWRASRKGPSTRPASTPPVRPQVISGPAAGTARRFAGTVATGTAPNSGRSSGRAPAWAASVTPRASASGRGPGMALVSRGASSRMPAEAPTDSPNPTERTSRGSTSTSTVTARARRRSRSAGRPRAAARQASAAMAPARRTDGSKRTRSANPPRTASVPATRGHVGSQPSNGRASARTKTRFCPETASRCVSPAARKSSASSGGWWRSSPRTMPVSSERERSGSAPAPSSRVRRTPLAARAAGAPVPAAMTSSIDSRPTTRRWMRHGVGGPGGRRWPRTAARSPASRSSRSHAGGPCAVASTRRPSTDARKDTPPPSSGSGSPTRRIQPSNDRDATGSRPSRAASARPAARIAAARHSSHGRRAARATSTSAAPMTGAGPPPTYAPMAVATASTTAARSDTLDLPGELRVEGAPVRGPAERRTSGVGGSYAGGTTGTVGA